MVKKKHKISLAAIIVAYFGAKWASKKGYFSTPQLAEAETETSFEGGGSPELYNVEADREAY